MIIALAKKDCCRLYKAWQHLMQTRFQEVDQHAQEEQQAQQAHQAHSKFELVDERSLVGKSPTAHGH
jgi:hypothetical protein